MKLPAVVVTVSLLLMSGSGPAAASETFAAFIAAQGCAIGPLTRALVVEAGYDSKVTDKLIAQADAMPGTVKTGSWIVLPSELCRIQPPDVHSEIRIGDPEVAATTSAIDDHANPVERGCFLSGTKLQEKVQATRGWDAERSNLEYRRFMAENLRSGSLAFYSDDPLRVPLGLQILVGTCGSVPQVGAIRKAQALRDQEFDALIRTEATNVICKEGASSSNRFNSLVKELSKEENTNAWLWSEIYIMTMGGGWYVRNTSTSSGIPRPPLCHFE